MLDWILNTPLKQNFIYETMYWKIDQVQSVDENFFKNWRYIADHITFLLFQSCRPHI